MAKKFIITQSRLQMKSHWMLLVIWLAILFSSASVECSPSSSVLPRRVKGSETSPSASHTYVFRGEYGRKPEEVIRAGGLMSKGWTRHYELPLTIEEEGRGSSLTEHVSGRNKNVSLFVSTTYSPSIALQFAIKGDTKEFYIYEIAPDKRAIDVPKSITKVDASYAQTQQEVAFVKGIPNKQITGYYLIKMTDQDLTNHKTVQEFREKFQRSFVRNPRFDKRYLSKSSAGKQSQFDKIYLGPTGSEFQDHFIKYNLKKEQRKEGLNPKASIMTLRKFFRKASPGEKILDSSRPNWTLKDNNGINGVASGQKKESEKGQSRGGRGRRPPV